MSDWEKRLRTEGLAPLDYEANNGAIIVDDKGSGNMGKHDVPWEQEQANREAMAAEMDRRRDIQRRARFRTPRDRAVWKLYAAGTGYQSIAKQLRTSERQVRNVLARIEAASRPGAAGRPPKYERIAMVRYLEGLIQRSDREVLKKLFGALVNA